jgi:hypothetical protein
MIVTKPAISPARIIVSGILPAEFNADAGYVVHTYVAWIGGWSPTWIGSLGRSAQVPTFAIKTPQPQCSPTRGYSVAGHCDRQLTSSPISID